MLSAINEPEKLRYERTEPTKTPKVDPFFSKENMEYLHKVINDIETGKSQLREHELLEV